MQETTNIDITNRQDVSERNVVDNKIEITQNHAIPQDSFWGDDISILFNTNRWVEFFPTSDQSLSERMNSVTRLVIYISIALAVYQGKATALHFGALIVVMIYFMWKNYTKGNIVESMDPLLPKSGIIMPSVEVSQKTHEQLEKNCVMPTPQNPFMNYLAGDNPSRASACKGSGVQEMASNLLDKQLFEDVDDLFSKNGNQRLFRTMPSTTQIPDREKYANWLIKGSDNCKEDKICPPFDDLRLQRQLIPEDLENFPVSGFNL